jgi:hypothetical protein
VDQAEPTNPFVGKVLARGDAIDFGVIKGKKGERHPPPDDCPAVTPGMPFETPPFFVLAKRVVVDDPAGPDRLERGERIRPKARADQCAGFFHRLRLGGTSRIRQEHSADAGAPQAVAASRKLSRLVKSPPASSKAIEADYTVLGGKVYEADLA